MDDLISRQDALDALCDACTLASVKSECIFKNLESCMDHNAILDVPAIEERWIPCSERLPEDSGWYIVTKELDYDTTFVGLEWYDSTNGWKYDNAKCIAWMPLLEPYKGEQE